MKLSIGKCWALLIFDLVGLAISGYAYLLGFQILQTLPQANAFIILMAFFVGIKIVILALYDLNRNLMKKNIPFIGALISVLGNVIIFGISFFLIPEVPYYFFIGLAIADFLIISLSHFLWWVIIGKESLEKTPRPEKTSSPKEKMPKEKAKREKTPKNKKEPNDKWFSKNNDEDEYDSIFDALLKNNEANQQVEKVDSLKPPIPPRNIFEEEKKYATSEFLKDVRKNRSPDKSRSQFNQDPPNQDLPSDWQREKTDQVIPPEKTGLWENDFFDSASQTLALTTEKDQIFEIEPDLSFDNSPPEAIIENQSLRTIDFDNDDSGDFNAIEKRLGLLFSEIEKSMEDTHYLQEAIAVFQEEVKNYQPIKGDEKMVIAGSLIREKLKAIIDKQMIVDEVLDDLIHLSKVINRRIDDLDRIEAGLNKRKLSLDQKEEILLGKKQDQQRIEILPEELVVENLDSEYIVAEEDYETIQRYLKRIK